jgi:hypothetical protein
MSLANLIKKGSLGRLATATPATPATSSPCSLSTVATVANVAVAIETKKAANEPGAENLQKHDVAVAPASLDPDRWCWPHSSAMNTAEIDTVATRVHHFQERRLTALDAQKLADQLVNRDREGDYRQLCLNGMVAPPPKRHLEVPKCGE